MGYIVCIPQRNKGGFIAWFICTLCYLFIAWSLKNIDFVLKISHINSLNDHTFGSLLRQKWPSPHFLWSGNNKTTPRCSNYPIHIYGKHGNYRSRQMISLIWILNICMNFDDFFFRETRPNCFHLPLTWVTSCHGTPSWFRKGFVIVLKNNYLIPWALIGTPIQHSVTICELRINKWEIWSLQTFSLRMCIAFVIIPIPLDIY